MKMGSCHVIAVVGAATAGSEIARVLAARSARVIVFEQNPRPYGKIEDGLPRWHAKQRRDEYEEINKRLENAGIEYVPSTRMGTDVSFDELRSEWGLSAIVLTHGAWRDRPFPVNAADQYVGRGLIYQNPLIYWFNHYQEHGYDGPRFDLAPGGIVIGGGLASFDVVKVLQLENTITALRARGIEADMIQLEREGIDEVLKKLQLDWRGLGVAPCKLFYRRRVIDMPLSDIPNDAPQKRADALRQARVKILEKAQRKYLFEFEDQRIPNEVIVEGDRLTGLSIGRTEVVEGKARRLPGTDEEVRGPFVISSIGSIPEEIPGIPQQGEVYQYADVATGLLMDGPTRVYAAGNVLTGKGNIKDSLDNATEVGTDVAERYLGLADDGQRAPLADGARERANREATAIAASLASRAELDEAAVAKIIEQVRARQKQVGYDGDYRGWIKRVTPPDLG
jgi:NADPH-dependent glutamate synthase beta subunit-like oxidoreductase